MRGDAQNGARLDAKNGTMPDAEYDAQPVAGPVVGCGPLVLSASHCGPQPTTRAGPVLARQLAGKSAVFAMACVKRAVGIVVPYVVRLAPASARP